MSDTPLSYYRLTQIADKAQAEITQGKYWHTAITECFAQYMGRRPTRYDIACVFDEMPRQILEQTADDIIRRRKRGDIL